jgi:long-chain fatty acid transport protein
VHGSRPRARGNSWALARLVATLGCVLALGFGAPRGASASPPDLFGFGSRSPAMAGTGVAFSDDYESTFLNPAGLAHARQRSLVFGLQGGAYRFELDGSRLPMAPIKANTIGGTIPLPFGGLMEDRLTLGLGFYTPLDVVLVGDIGYADLPCPLVLERAQSLAIQVGLGVDLHGLVDGLRIGASLTALGSFAGSIVAGIDATGKFGSVVETQVVSSFAPIVGASYDVGDFSFGAVWRGRIESDFVFKIVTRDLPLTVPVLNIGGIAQYDPHTLVFEAAWRPTDSLLVSGGVSYALWSEYPGPLVTTSRGSPKPPAVNFSDTLSPRVSAEYTLRRRHTALKLRLGYAYVPSPAPAARAEARYLDNDRHLLTAGAGFELSIGSHGERMFLDGYLSASVMPERTHDAPAPGGTTNMRTSGFVGLGGWSLGVAW